MSYEIKKAAVLGSGVAYKYRNEIIKKLKKYYKKKTKKKKQK